ncbi:hypothetical protein SCLCIDRAFT_141029, partial [Scleroderma citrinum Foug A]
LMKEWVSPIYAFFDPVPQIIEENRRRAHEFKCSARACKTKVRRYLDKKDARFTSNMRKHAKKCWGEEAVATADDAQNAGEARKHIVGSILRHGSITASFERKGKGNIGYSHRQHTCRFQSLMKTGRPEYYLPHPTTVSHDVQLVFACTHQCLAKMLHEYNGKVNFTTDTWTSPNHKAFVAFAVHLEHNGVPLVFPLDVIEVAKVHT